MSNEKSDEHWREATPTGPLTETESEKLRALGLRATAGMSWERVVGKEPQEEAKKMTAFQKRLAEPEGRLTWMLFW